MQPARSVGIFGCTWKISLHDGSPDLLFKKKKKYRGIRSVSLTCTELCPLRQAVLLGKEEQRGTDKHIEVKLRGSSARPDLCHGSGLCMTYFSPLAPYLPPSPPSGNCFALRAAPVTSVSMWVRLCEPACSQRSYFYSLHYWRIWPVFPSLQLCLPMLCQGCEA